MADIGIGQAVLINGTNSKRKAAEGIPINVLATIISISFQAGKVGVGERRPTVYNVQTTTGQKYGLTLKEFKVLGVEKDAETT